jgi:hypothetical protein
MLQDRAPRTVKDSETANAVWTLLGNHYKQEAVESESVTTSFFKAEKNKIELLAARSAKCHRKIHIASEREFIMSLLPR